jgi:hypothetical protein
VAHKIHEIISNAEGIIPKPCHSNCKYWKFPHLDRPCVLSEVFSVKKNELCYTFEKQIDI